MYVQWFPPDPPERGSFAFGERGDGGSRTSPRTSSPKSLAIIGGTSGSCTTTASISNSDIAAFIFSNDRSKRTFTHKAITNRDACADTGAGMHVTPHVKLLKNKRAAHVKVKGFSGSSVKPRIMGTLGTLNNVLGCPSAATTLVSVGACVEGTLNCISFYKDAAYKIAGIRIFKDSDNNIQCHIGPKITIEHFANRDSPTGVYKIPGGIDFFAANQSKPTVFANLAKYVQSSKGTSRDIWQYHGSHELCPKCHMPRSRTPAAHDLIYAALSLPDYAETYEFTVDQLTASQHKYALRLLRMHNAYGHVSKRYLRWILQRSPNKSDRELAKYIDLLSLCNHCIRGDSKHKGHNKSASGQFDIHMKFLSDIVADCSGKQNIATASGYQYFMLIVCKKTSFAWVKLLKSLTEVAREFEIFLREIKQHTKKPIKRFKADHGPADFGNLNFTNLLKKYDIERHSTGGSSTHNPKAERRIGLLQTDILKYMSWACAPRVWWGYCSKYAVTTRNLIPIPTNPGHESPYEAAYNRAPDRSLQQPFGCLVYANVPRIDRHGKLNHRGTTRTCAFLDYVLRPDGHPLAYLLFDCDTGEVITRPKEYLTFNPDVPAMQHVARNVSDLPDGKFINDIAAKYWGDQLHYGKIVSHRVDDDGELLWHVVYEDGDSEDLNISEVVQHTRMAKKEPPSRHVTIPHKRDNSTATSLRQALRSTNSTSNNAIGDAIMAHMRSSSASAQNAIKLPHLPPPPPPLPVTSHQQQHCKRPIRNAPRHLSNISVLGDIDNNLHSKTPMFNIRDTRTRRKLLVAMIEKEINAFGFLVEPPPSEIPEIVIKPNTKARNIPVPKNYKEAVTGPYRKYWQKAIATEIFAVVSGRKLTCHRMLKSSKDDMFLK